MSDVGAWLRSLGLERFIELFEANEIDAATLPKLTNDDLNYLEIPLGPRKKLLEAIAALDQTPSGGGSQPQSPSPQAGPPTGQAERRQLTVMFVDLVGSTALSARLDPEEMGAVLRGYQNAVAGEVARFEGHVAKFMGDGVLAYFGWPRAHEDEAERAVRAGLAIVAAVARLDDGAPLACRIGIATGLVVVGELIGQGAASEESVVGETPNLAARLQALAAPGQIVVGETTRRLLGVGFVLEALGARALKGIEHPVTAFAVTGERLLASRFEGRSERLQPMVGRDQELALLLERWAQAKAGEGQAVLLVGEAGVGKSRISRALLDALGPEPHTRIRYQCSPYHGDTALWPVVQQLGHAAGFATGEPVESRLDKLEALLARSGQEGNAAPLVAELLGLDGSDRYGVSALSPQARRARTLEALIGQLVGLAARQPVLLLIEDVHWIDPTTLELVELCLDATTSAPVLMLLTTRPDQQPALAVHPHVTRLSLNRLGRASAVAIVAGLGGDHLPQPTVDAIIARTDGVPLYVEELTKAVLETGEAAIPASLHDSLMARLDRIPEVKEVAQIAACVGREFDYALLLAITDRPEAELAAALDKLVNAALVFCRGHPPAARYSFKHALVRDAAYESLLRSRRRLLHERIAEALESRFPDRADAEPEILAFHFTAAGLPEKAAPYWAVAGHRAVQRSANREAIQHVSKALDLMASLEPSPDHRERELDLLMALGSAYSATAGFAAPEVEQTYERVRELCRQLGDARRARPALQGLRVLYMVRGDLSAAARLGHELLRDSDDSPLHEFEGEVALGIVDALSGRIESARSRLEQARALSSHARQLSLAHQPTGSLEVVCAGHLSGVLYLAGYPERSRDLRAEALRIARASAHPFSLAQALGSALSVNAVRREAFDLETASELVAIAEEHSFDFWHIWGCAWRGWARANRGQPEQGLVELRQSIADAEVMGAELIVAQILAPLAATLGYLGQTDEALALVDRQRAVAERTGIRSSDALVFLTEATVRSRSAEQQTSAIEACLKNALSTARSQGNRAVELRAARDLARLWAERGERQQALDLLAPVYGWFTEGFDTPDLLEAKALLAAL